MMGLFAESLWSVMRYDEMKNDGIVDPGIINHKHEIMLKLFRSQRNMYLTFIVNFNWIVLYGIRKFIYRIYTLELIETIATKNINDREKKIDNNIHVLSNKED